MLYAVFGDFENLKAYTALCSSNFKKKLFQTRFANIALYLLSRKWSLSEVTELKLFNKYSISLSTIILSCSFNNMENLSLIFYGEATLLKASKLFLFNECEYYF